MAEPAGTRRAQRVYQLKKSSTFSKTPEAEKMTRQRIRAALRAKQG